MVKKKTSSAAQPRIPVRKDTVLAHPIQKRGEERVTVIYPLDQPDSYYTVTGRIQEVWNLINGRRSSAEIAQSLCRKYKIPAAEGQKQIRAILQDFKQAGLIRIR